jgi:hypothetical protein
VPPLLEEDFKDYPPFGSRAPRKPEKEVERGLRDVEAGRVVDQDEAKRRMAKWLGGIVDALT